MVGWSKSRMGRWNLGTVSLSSWVSVRVRVRSNPGRSFFSPYRQASDLLVIPYPRHETKHAGAKKSHDVGSVHCTLQLQL